MITVYISTDENGKIVCCDTNKSDDEMIQVEIANELYEDFKILSCYYKNGEIVFDKEDYNNQTTQQQKDQEIAEAKRILADIQMNTVLMSIPDEQAYSVKVLYPEWDGNGYKYKQGDRFMYNGKFYKVLQDHTSQAEWLPDKAPSLYVEISDPSEEWPEFKQPSGAHDAYMKNDKVTYNGKHYISLIDSNTWSPDAYPAGWKLVE